MARKSKGRSKAATKRAGRATRPRPAKRLPSGSYAWKGKAIPFSRLPKTEKARLRSSWATKAAKERKAPRKVPRKAVAKGPTPASQARSWVKRRTEWVPKHGQPHQYAAMVEPEAITAQLTTREILRARKVQKAAHSAWIGQGKHGGGDAFAIISETYDQLGAEIAKTMPQLWWYH